MSGFPLARLAYGGDYNPEQWPESVWEEDVRLMREAGVTLVSLGIFAWARLEPRPGQYDFAWLDRVIDLLHAGGVQVDLATATASPPPWLARLRPESLPVTAAGVTLWPGGRQAYCPSSAAYREAAAALVRRLAERYAGHPALALWHIGNEYACHVSECFCDESARHFRAWLRARYGSLDALNAAWGTAFWSQQYGEWEEIQPPRSAPTYANPTQQLDWRRFSSDALLECFEIERAILRELTPAVPVTTNFMGDFKPLDYWAWAAREDFVSLDYYADPADPAAHVGAAMNFDLSRSLGGGRPWLLMEQAPSQVNWRPHNLVKAPGQMRLWSHQAIARGSAGVMFFQWRASKAGAEKFHSGMLPHAGTDTRTWREVAELGQELRRLEGAIAGRVCADVAILLDWESWWALELDSRPSQDVRLIEQVRAYYEPLFRRSIGVDFARPGADLSGYRLVLAPNLYLVRDEAARAIEAYVEAGGVLAMAFFSGIVDEHDHIRLGGYPAPFRRLLGLRVEEFTPLAPGAAAMLVAGDARLRCDLWADQIGLEGAAALASFADGPYAGRPAITHHALGAGHAYYLGTRLDGRGMAWLLEAACARAGVRPAAAAPRGVEAVLRRDGARALLHLLNHGDAPATVPLDGPGLDLLSGQRHDGALELGPREVAILQLEEAP